MKYLLIVLFCLFSCKKYYSCECTFTDPVSGSEVTSADQLGKLSKKDAEADCALTQTGLAEFNAACSITKD